MDDKDKALAYYKAAITKREPPFVPSRVHVLCDVYGDWPFPGAGVVAGEHACETNTWGAVSVLDRAGVRLGLKPDEFDPVEWRENTPATS